MTDVEFQRFLKEATEYTQSRQKLVEEEFGLINGHDRYDYDMPSHSFKLSNESKVYVLADIVAVVGSYSTISDTWLWSWGNSHYDPADIGEIELVRKFGELHGISKLTEAKWSAEEVDGWEMTSVSARLLEAQAVYRPPDENGCLFLLLNNFRQAEPTLKS